RVGKSVLFATESVRHHSLTQTNESPEKSGRFILTPLPNNSRHWINKANRRMRPLRHFVRNWGLQFRLR
ncbi:hypothetical protein, partial [Nitrosomonas ureae]|uniref:hypothetical protein n=1 Tax=Nitrosomonas ureae TaxID=44577 RepID=UPI001CA56979